MLSMYGRPAGTVAPTGAAAASPGMSKTKLALMVGGGLAAIFGTVLTLDNIAHPKLSNTSPDNPYGLQPTKYCNAYGVPFMQDHWGTVWDKSTFTKVDPNNPPYTALCSDAATEAAPMTQNSPAVAAPGALPVQRRSLDESTNLLSKRAPLGWTAAGMAGASGSLMYIMYLDKLHKQKEQAVMNAYNNEYHTAGEAASSQGNSISTGAAGQLFNPMSGNLVLVDPNSGQTYDSGTGEAVNSQTGLPLAYSSSATSTGTTTASDQSVPANVPQVGSQNGATPNLDPSLQQAMDEWNSKSPQEQQRLLAQYGQAATSIATSADPDAALQQYESQLSSSAGNVARDSASQADDQAVP